MLFTLMLTLLLLVMLMLVGGGDGMSSRHAPQRHLRDEPLASMATGRSRLQQIELWPRPKHTSP